MTRFKTTIMKTITKTLYLSLVCLALIFTGCNKSDDAEEIIGGGGGAGGGGSEFLIATVDGSSFEAAQSPAVIVAATTSNNVLTLHGGTNEGNTIRATINGYTGVGTYTTGDGISNVNSLSYLTLPANIWMSTFDIGSGIIEVTSDDGTTVEGTFSFEGFNAQDQSTKNISGGSFMAIID